MQERKHAYGRHQERETERDKATAGDNTQGKENTDSSNVVMTNAIIISFFSQLLQLLQATGARVELTFVRVDRRSGKEVQRQGHIPDIDSALALVIVLVKSRSVDHCCVIYSTGGLCSPHQINPANEHEEHT